MYRAGRIAKHIEDENEETTEKSTENTENKYYFIGDTSFFADHLIYHEVEKLGLTAQIRQPEETTIITTGNSFHERQMKKSCSDTSINDQTYQEESYIKRRSSFSRVSHELSYGKSRGEHVNNTASLVLSDGSMMNRSLSAGDIFRHQHSGPNNTIMDELNNDNTKLSLDLTKAASHHLLDVAQRAYKNLLKDAGTNIYPQKDTKIHQHDIAIVQNCTSNMENSAKVIQQTHSSLTGLSDNVDSKLTENTNMLPKKTFPELVEWTLNHKVKQSRREKQLLIPVF